LLPNSKKAYYAGDDDQCIFNWAGANVTDFLHSTQNSIVLDQSYRVPYSIHKVAENIIRKVTTRKQKDWKPREEEGLVSFYFDIMDINFNEGEWYILARTNRILHEISKKLEDEGYFFWREGTGWSVSEGIINSIQTWIQLCKDKSLSVQQWIEFSRKTKKGIIGLTL
jgi:hypothetical protein